MAKHLVANILALSKLIITLLMLNEVAKGFNHSCLQNRGHSHLVVGILVVNLEHA